MNKLFLKKVFLSGVIAFVLSACGGNHKSNDNLSKNFKSLRSLVARDSVDLEAMGMLAPMYVTVAEDSVWIAGEGLSSSMLFLLTTRGELVAEGVQIGNGPDEVLEVTSLHRIRGCTYLYDSRSGKLCRVQRRDSVLSVVPLDMQRRLCDDLVTLSNDAFLTLPLAQDHSYTLTDKAGTVIDSLAYFPAKPDEGVTDFTHSLACVGPLAVTADGKHFARALVYDGGVDFFGVDSLRLFHIARYERFGMDYDVIDVGQAVPTLSPTTKVGFPDLAVSAHRYYAQYSEAPAAGNSTREACTVCSFDLEGRPLNLYLLDRNASAIAVTPDDERLFAVGCAAGQEESVYLFSYDL